MASRKVPVARTLLPFYLTLISTIIPCTPESPVYHFIQVDKSPGNKDRHPDQNQEPSLPVLLRGFFFFFYSISSQQTDCHLTYFKNQSTPDSSSRWHTFTLTRKSCDYCLSWRQITCAKRRKLSLYTHVAAGSTPPPSGEHSMRARRHQKCCTISLCKQSRPQLM